MEKKEKKDCMSLSERSLLVLLSGFGATLEKAGVDQCRVKHSERRPKADIRTGASIKQSP